MQVHKIRVATFNLAAQNEETTCAQQKLLMKYSVDIVGLQEVDEHTQRNPYSMLETLKEGLYPFGYFSQAMAFENGNYGLATISKVPIIEANAYNYQLENGMEEPRIFQHSIIDYQEKKLSVYNTHLSYENKSIRKNQLRQLKETLDRDTISYKIILGDFNTDQCKTELNLFIDDYQVLNGQKNQSFDTYNQRDEMMQVYAIDNIIISQNIKVLNTTMIETKLSDHNLLFADLLLL